MQERYNIELLKKRALADLEFWLPQWYPKGHGRKGYFEIGDVSGVPGDSLKISLNGNTRGLWYDFATGEGGDFFSLWGINRNLLHFGRVLSDIASYYGIKAEEVNNTKENLGSPDCRYLYLNADGSVCCYMYRYELADGSKVFRPWNAENGKYEFPQPRPLYQLSKLTQHDKVIVVEGEKCADALGKAGYLATTLMGGANSSVDKTDLTPLKGKNVILWPDNDLPGKVYVRNVGNALLKLPVASLKITPATPGKPSKWDAADAVAENFDLVGHLAAAKEYVPETATESRIAITKFTADMFVSSPPELQFIVKDTIPRGVVGLLSAMGDTGKGLLLLDLALKVCRDKVGMELKAFGNSVMTTGSVVIFAGEDTADEIHRRIYKLCPQGLENGFDKNKLHIIPLPNHGGPFSIAVKNRGSDEFKLSDEFTDIENQLAEIKDLALIVFDPLSSFAGLDVNSDPRAASFITGRLAALATRTNAAIIIAHHIRKNDGITTPLEAREAIRGTSAIVDGVRFALSFWQNVQEEKKIFQELGQDFRENSCFKGAVVKANFAADRGVRNYLRNSKNGLLEEIPIKIVVKPLKAAEFEMLLIQAIGKAQKEGEPFAISGASGLYENRDRLPVELQKASRDFIRHAAKNLVNQGKIIKINITGSSDKKWLGLPMPGGCS